MEACLKDADAHMRTTAKASKSPTWTHKALHGPSTTSISYTASPEQARLECNPLPAPPCISEIHKGAQDMDQLSFPSRSSASRGSIRERLFRFHEPLVVAVFHSLGTDLQLLSRGQCHHDLYISAILSTVEASAPPTSSIL